MSRGRGHKPDRTCIVCRKKRKKQELVRMVLRDSFVIIDERNRLSGRGAYVCKQGPCLGLALGNPGNCLNRAFRTGRVRV